MRVGTLYAVLKLNTNAFDASLARSSGAWGKFTSALKAGVFLAAEAFGAVLVGSVLAATSFQKHMTESLAIMGDVSAVMRQKMEEAARAVAKTTLFTANEAADAFYYLASAGYTAEQSIAALPQVAAFAQAGLIGLEDATRMLAQIQTTLGLRTGDASQDLLNMARITDVLTQAANESLGTIEGFADALSRQAGPALRLVNKSVEEGVAILSVFADQGIVGARAGTALAIVLRDLSTKALKNKEEFAKFGISVFDASGKMRDTADIVQDLERALGGMSDAQKKATLLQLGFTDRSLGFILALVGQSSKLRQYEADLRSAGGATQEVAARQLESFSAQLTIMWHKITDVAIAIGQRMLPGLTSAATAIGNWFDANEELIVQLVTGFLGAIGSVASFIGRNLGPAIDTIADKVRAVKGVLSEFAAAWDEVFGKVETVSKKVGGFMDTMGEPVEKLNTNMHGFLEAVEGTEKKVNPFIGALKAMKEKIEDIGDLLRPVLDKLDEYNVIGLILAGTITGILGGALIALAAWLLPFVAIATGVVAATLAINEAWKEWGDDISGAVGDAIHWLATTVLPDLQRAAEGIGDWVADHKDEILEFLGHMGDVGKTAFDIIVQAIQIAEPILVHIAEVVLPALGAAMDVAMTIINTAFDKLGDVWKWLGDRFNDLGINIDDFKGALAVLTPLLDAFILLVGVRLVMAFGSLILSMGLAAISMSVTLVTAIANLALSIGFGVGLGATGLLGRIAAIGFAFGPVGILLGAAVLLWITDLGGFRTQIQNTIDDITDLKNAWNFNGLNPLEPGAFFGGKTGDNGLFGLFPPPTSPVLGPPAPTTSGAPYDRRYTQSAYASGVPWQSGGWAMVGEQGPELVNLPRGAGVMNAGQTAGALSAMSGLSIAIDKVEINTTERADSPGVSRRIAQGILDEVAVGIQEQASRLTSRPRLALG